MGVNIQCGSYPHEKPDPRINWVLKPDPDRFDIFWFYDATSEQVCSYEREDGTVLSVYVAHNRTLELTIDERVLDNRYAVRCMRGRNLRDREIRGFRKKGFIDERGYFQVYLDREPVAQFHDLHDVQNYILGRNTHE